MLNFLNIIWWLSISWLLYIITTTNNYSYYIMSIITICIIIFFLIIFNLVMPKDNKGDLLKLIIWIPSIILLINGIIYLRKLINYLFTNYWSLFFIIIVLTILWIVWLILLIIVFNIFLKPIFIRLFLSKKCPYCKEKVLPDAIKCKHCGEFIK